MTPNPLPGGSGPLHQLLLKTLARDGGWLPFDRYMAMALYAPGMGYYASHRVKFGAMPGSGSDFVTAPELTPVFGRTLAAQVAEALVQTGTREVWEFGAGSGALAAQLLDALGDRIDRYTIVDLSGTLQERQRERLAPHATKTRWLSELPERFEGVIVGNEVLDAMPVQLLVRLSGVWHERGVGLDADRGLVWVDRPTALRPPCDIVGTHDYLTEIHPQAEAFVRTLAERLQRGAAFFIDYGFPEHEYYHAQRDEGTVMCHRAHLADTDPLQDPGEKDITAHVNFTGIALAGQDALDAQGRPCDFGVLGYTTQARFLLNCGLLDQLAQSDVRERAHAQKLIAEQEMGEFFKVIGFHKGPAWDALGFAQGDRSHTL